MAGLRQFRQGGDCEWACAAKGEGLRQFSIAAVQTGFPKPGSRDARAGRQTGGHGQPEWPVRVPAAGVSTKGGARYSPARLLSQTNGVPP